MFLTHQGRNAKTAAMKHVILFALLFISVLVLSSEALALNVRGFVYLDQQGYAFIESVSLRAFPVRPMNAEVAKDLRKLSSYDSLIGSGEFSKSGELQLESIDFVALLRLLGVWKSSEAIVNFRDYSRVSIRVPEAKADYTYTMAPAEGNSWRIFFTDKSSVVLGAVSVQNNSAKMEIYDSKTGEVSQSLQLQKVQ